MQTMNIIFRSCANVKKMSKGSDRPFSLNKDEIILKSLKFFNINLNQYFLLIA